MMNQKLWSGFTAALITTALTTTSSGCAQATKPVGHTSKTNDLTASALPEQKGNPRAFDASKAETGSELHSQTTSQAPNAVKVGEYQARNRNSTDANVVAKIETHQIEGRQSATVYVRDIPVLTFLGSSSSTNGETKMGKAGDSFGEQQADLHANSSGENSGQQAESESQNSVDDPVWQATNLAAKLNQLSREGIDAKTIAVVWNGESNSNSTTLAVAGERTNQRQARQIMLQKPQERYLIQVNGEKLVEIDADTRLPDTTNNLAEDALQVTNRLRRLMGDAPPLRDIAGRPASRPIRIALNTRPVLSRITGLASWYGPGFHGRRSANGEIYNQNAFTAAHRSLPFGTQVRVTNVNNGLSVIVRINDRGPFIRGRIIDLSAAAARTLGIVQTGVAPVSLEILGKPQTVATE